MSESHPAECSDKNIARKLHYSGWFPNRSSKFRVFDDWTIELILLTNERMKHSYFNINSNVSNPLALRKHYGPMSSRPSGLFSSFFVPFVENKVSLTRKVKQSLLYCLLKAVLLNTRGPYEYHKLAHSYSSSLHFWSVYGWVASSCDKAIEFLSGLVMCY